MALEENYTDADKIKALVEKKALFERKLEESEEFWLRLNEEAESLEASLG